MATQMDENINTEELISEIENYPAIWDISCSDYSNKHLKKNSWEAVLVKFYPDFAEKTYAEQNNIAVRVQRKWKSLRDCYTRELAKLKSEMSGSGCSGRKQYIYFNQLSFLQTSKKATTSRIAEELSDVRSEEMVEVIIEENIESNEIPVSPMLRAKARRRKTTSSSSKKSEDKLFVALANQIMKTKAGDVEKDEDTLFMLSLVTELKKVPDDLKLDVKSELINVFRKFRNTQRVTALASPPP
ncbi:uncharacterized protein LOC109541876 isoform X1 [Dendroctonus ponderosae]|uniref:MADF domain-containing protein n=1 Tax=Dendroctonus ponderosae TaxID=77166 RepID=A0AAR5PZJ9_DENPD|nr:uncharacterized protein LOC109541876 isoform X1 [Dendroctonus ponderosae]XP_019766430.1 uncharacterized protein LOC109541876 isoform X1 [Dendroctonus ponderosae]XP_019766432.1 uncharacterized protein LOC109541876 isoform X1 [Dendroctonus ponderosae]XP_048517014.1 uncharacterized protein LOC109541876 isoform X1 [Dendroctonus ponderosae]XP_048517015.1 uncharacterized protein LOC109541876 isoform X1 [Dendroctonus ponderosae]KAH1021534.1 hypothetical protein HUJ04_011037 [Dendroctonus ponderosa